MKHLILILIAIMACAFPVDICAQARQVKAVDEQMKQARNKAGIKVPKVPRVLRLPKVKRVRLVTRKWKPITLNPFKAAEIYQSAFETLSKDTTATGDDYLMLYYTMACDSLYTTGYHKFKLENVADKYLEVENPTPESLAEVLDIARQQFPNQRKLFLSTLTPSGLLVARATPRYYRQVLDADTTFTDRDAAILSQLYDDHMPMATNDGSILYYYLTGAYEYVIPPLEHFFKIYKGHPESDIKRNIGEIAPKFQLLERSLDAKGLTEHRDSLIADPTYQLMIKYNAPTK